MEEGLVGEGRRGDGGVFSGRGKEGRWRSVSGRGKEGRWRRVREGETVSGQDREGMEIEL